MKNMTLGDLCWLLRTGAIVDMTLLDENLNIVDKYYGPTPIPGARMHYRIYSIYPLYDRESKEPILRINCQ